MTRHAICEKQGGTTEFLFAQIRISSKASGKSCSLCHSPTTWNEESAFACAETRRLLRTAITPDGLDNHSRGSACHAHVVHGRHSLPRRNYHEEAPYQPACAFRSLSDFRPGRRRPG